MVFGKQSLQGYESNRRRADGVRVENIPRNHSVGPPREDSKSNDRLQCEQENFKGSMARKKETKKHVNTIHRIMLANSRAVIGLSWGLDQKKSGVEPTLTTPTDPGTVLHRK